ncbi:MAG TPA: WXG100 family type VII secretion target [Dermatophilaceae bacterium]|nr:WXG100 family type VII secretion target [Dermatophilaceae bacterium]
MAFSVDTDRIGSASADITRNAADIEQLVTGMVGRLGTLQGAWTGSAAAEFQGVLGEWQALQAQVRESLASLGSVLGKAGQSYATTEDSVRGMFVAR